jgi:hypothetical protein
MALALYLESGSRALELVGPGGPMLGAALDSACETDGSFGLTARDVRYPFDAKERVRFGKRRAQKLVVSACEEVIMQAVTAGLVKGSGLLLQTMRVANPIRSTSTFALPMMPGVYIDSSVSRSMNIPTISIDDEIVSVINRTSKTTAVGPKIQVKLAGPGEDLYVGTYTKSYGANVKSGLRDSHTAHHAVQNTVSNTSRGRGITINLRKDLHEFTRTYKNPVDLGLSPRQHLGRDIKDLRIILDDAGYEREVINTHLWELIRQNKAIGVFSK